MQCYCENITIFNTITGEHFIPNCKSYICPRCGKRNRGRLFRAVKNYIQDWDIIRMWTFTLSSKYFVNEYEHRKALSEVWRYFITYLRRANVLTRSQQKVQYIRFSEPHQSGYFHFHCLVDLYLPYYAVAALWSQAVSTVCDIPGDRGGCFVRGIGNYKNAAFYVVKYVTKSASCSHAGFRIWTKSSKVALFKKLLHSGVFIAYNRLTKQWYGCHSSEPLLVLYNSQRHNKIVEISLWTGLDPPDFLLRNQFSE